MKKCPACGKANSNESAFCTDCGAKLPSGDEMKICPGCGKEIPAAEAFCHLCGTKQPAAKAPEEAPSARTEREDEGVKIWPASTRSGGTGRAAGEDVRRAAETTRRTAARSSSRYVEELEGDPVEEEDYDDRKSYSARPSRKAAYRDDYDDDYDDDDDYEDEGMSLGMKIAIAVLGIAALAAVAAVVMVIMGGNRLFGSRKETQPTQAAAVETTAAPTEAPTTAPAPTEPEVAETAPAKTYGEPQVIHATVTATSCLDLAYYNPDYLMDLNADTAWAEGEEGLGEGTELTYSFNNKTWIYGIAILPGFQRSEDTFNSYSMPSKLTVDTGKVEIPISLAKYKANFSNPSSSCAYFKFSQPVQSDQVKVRIEEVKAGSTYKDTCITEMFFFYYPASESQAASSRPQITSAGWSGTPSGGGQPAATQADQQPQAGETTAAQASSDGDYVLPNSSNAYISASDLAGLSKEQLRLARNEIYARHGYRFNGADLKAYFESKSWYSGTISPDDFDESVLNEYEIANITTIRNAENQ